MNKRIIFIVLSLLAVISVGCNKSDGESTIYGKSWEEKWIVASKTITATGSSGPEICYWIKVDNNPVWQISHSQIEGFNYECGYEYELLVKVQEILDPPQDASSYEYTLLSVVSKILKESDVPLLTNTPLERISYAETFQVGTTFSDSITVIEGDILLSKEQAEAIVTRSGAIKDVTRYWPGNTVYCIIRSHRILRYNQMSKWLLKSGKTRRV